MKYLFDIQKLEYVSSTVNPYAITELTFKTLQEFSEYLSTEREKIKHDPHATLQEEEIEPVGHAYWVIDVT